MYKMSKLVKGAYLFLVFLLQACVLQSGYSYFAKDFFNSTNPKEWVNRMQSLSLEDQYRIYVYGMQVMHPPFFELAKPIAVRGRQAVPFLISKLDTTDDFEVRDIVFIIWEMERLRIYNAKDDIKLIESINKRIFKIKDPSWKRMTLDDLKLIKGS